MKPTYINIVCLGKYGFHVVLTGLVNLEVIAFLTIDLTLCYSVKNVDIKYSAQDPFLEQLSSSTLTIER
jgi:hypothetical protein